MNNLSSIPFFPQQFPEPSPIAPQLGINYPFPPNLEYQYPDINEDIIQNISNALIAVPKFYTQVLHLMNKMNIPPPFQSARPKLSVNEIKGTKRLSELAENESEKESDTESVDTTIPQQSESISNSLFINKKPKLISTTNTSIPSKTIKFSVLNKTSEPKNLHMETISQSNVINTNTIEEKNTKEDSDKLNKIHIFHSQPTTRTCASLKTIQEGILVKEELMAIPKFVNYSPGVPSEKLFIRNLSKTVTENDFYYLLGHLFKTDEETKKSIQIQLFKEGNLKNSAFITFPSIYLASTAMEHLHGYNLKGKPLLILFGKQKSNTKEHEVKIEKEEIIPELNEDDIIATL